jgi:hypothetical protein
LGLISAHNYCRVRALLVFNFNTFHELAIQVSRQVWHWCPSLSRWSMGGI